MLIDYTHMYPDAVIRYHASDIQLYINSDAAYIVLPNVRSRSAEHFYISDNYTNMTSTPHTKPNGSSLTECTTLRNFILSVAEDEVSTVHHHGKAAIPVHTALYEMGRPQEPTPAKTYNNTADGFLNKKIKQK